MKRLFLFLLCAMLASPMLAQKSVYKLSVKDGNGKTVKLKDYKGKVLLIVNTATKCGFTPQYEELQRLYDTYKSQGLEILDFPCNQFGEQAPGTYNDIHTFCTSTYGTTFPQFAKIDVNGPHESQLYTLLKTRQPFKGFDTNTKAGKYFDERFSKQDPNYAKDPSIKWNFTKFLVDRKGNIINRFEPTVDMQDVENAIRTALNL